MSDSTQISAFIATTTKERLERYTEAHGLKKGAVIEAALLHHLQALEELPVDLVVPPRILLDDDEFQRVADLVANPPAPTAATLALMNGELVVGFND